jgi:hypothetical protein
LRREGKQIWRDGIVDTKCGNIERETGIRGNVEWKNKEQWEKIWIYMNKYKEGWEMMVTKNDKEVEMHSDDQ